MTDMMVNLLYSLSPSVKKGEKSLSGVAVS